MMQKPQGFTPNRPFAQSRRPPRTRTEAAVELVRLEFEAARLGRDLDQLERRKKASSQALTRVEGRSAALLRLLAPEQSP